MTNSSSPPLNKLLIYYQGVLAVGVVAIFFTKLDVFLEHKGFGLPLYWFVGFLLASVPLWTSAFSKIRYIPPLLFGWFGLYLAMSSVSILILPTMPSMQLLEDQIRSIVFLLLMLLLFSQHTLVQTWVKVAILIVSLMNVFNHIYEFINPLAFGAFHAEGRPGGFYIDSNEAGCALILGMIFAIDLVKPRYRLFYALVIGLGVVLSFSRGAMLGWLIVILFFMFTKVIPRYQISYLGITLAVAIFLITTQTRNLTYLQTADGKPLFNKSTLARIEFLADPLSEKQDTSRLLLLDDAWQSFAEQPFLGKGLGGSRNSQYTSNAGTGQKPHNTYLQFMIEYGFLGFIIYPFLILSAMWNGQGKVKNYGLAFALFLFVWGIFSHTTVSSFFILLAIAYMACLTRSSQLKTSKILTEQI